MKTCIVIPTYNEKENIEIVIEKIFGLGVSELYILVVDDNSPDGTGGLVERLKIKYQNLDIIHRQRKAGLGKAYEAGFRQALKRGAEYIFEMDADLSHDSKHIPEFLNAIKSHDLVLGSRYIQGGGVRNWNFTRRLISKVGNLYARMILGIPYKDLTGGFKCYRRKVLESIDFSKISSVGYNFQIETTYIAYKKGFRIVEIPIIFAERTQGKSKFHIKIVIESFWKVLLLKFKNQK